MQVYHWTLGLFLVTYINYIINFMQIMYNVMHIYTLLLSCGNIIIVVQLLLAFHRF